MGKASICIVTRNRLSKIKKCLKAIWRCSDSPFELLIADNASTDGSKEYLKMLRRERKIKLLILNNSNLGYATAVNKLIEKSRQELIITIDDDFLIKTKGWIKKIQDAFEKNNEIGILGVNCEGLRFRRIKKNATELEVKTLNDEPFNIGGWCIAIPRKTFLEIGYFNKEFRPYGIEDADYGFRVYLIGKLNCYLPSIKGEHKCTNNSAEKNNSAEFCQILMAYNIVQYLKGRKSIYTTEKQFPLRKSEDIMKKELGITVDTKKMISEYSYKYLIELLKSKQKMVKDFFEVSKYAIIKVGYLCNNNCVICHEKENRRRLNREFDKKENLRKIDLCLKHGVSHIIFSGGEPTIMRNLPEYIKYAKSKGIHCELITNGRIFSNSTSLIKLDRVSKVYVSLFDNIAEHHDKITRVPGSYKQTIKGIRNLIEHNKNIMIRLILTKKNITRIKEIITYLVQLGVREITLVNIIPWGYALESLEKYYVDIAKASKIIKEIIDTVDCCKIYIENIPRCYIGAKYAEHFDARMNNAMIFRYPSAVKEEKSKITSYKPLCKRCIYYNKECSGLSYTSPEYIKTRVYPIR